MFQATFWNNHKTFTVVPITEKKACGFPHFFYLSSKISFTHIFFCSSNIRNFTSGLMSNKNILSVSIFNNVMRFEIRKRSVHCTLVHCGSWTQCDHSSLPCVVGRIPQCKRTAVYFSAKERPYTSVQKYGRIPHCKSTAVYLSAKVRPYTEQLRP
jgi:hypothetical protein